MDRRHAAGALLALAVCIASSDAAPAASNQTSLDLYDAAAEGCYYNFQHYGEGDRIMTNEPCLNCTCHNRMLMCYLRVCPFTKPIGQDCTVEKRADQCCPIVTCPDVPVDLLTSTSTTSPAEYGATGVGKLDKYGCSINGKYFPEGAKVPPTPNKPCEHCYCIRNMTTCVMQECTLHVDGCTPIYNKDVCCPVRYSCDHPEDEVLLLDDMTTTVRPTPGFLLTTTTLSPVTQMSQDCVHEERIVADGAMIKTEKACEHCYCMKGDIVCVVQECGTPMENEGKNCASQAPREGQCCPDTYICEGDDVATDLPSDYTTQLFVSDKITTLSPPRRVGVEGSGYRKETEESYTEMSPFETDAEGSGYDHGTESGIDIGTSEKHTPDIISETTEDILYVTSTARTPILEEIEKTTEPDKGLNTVPSGQFDEDASEPSIPQKTTTSEEMKFTESPELHGNKDDQTEDRTILPEVTLTPILTDKEDESSITTETVFKQDDEITKVTEHDEHPEHDKASTPAYDITEKTTSAQPVPSESEAPSYEENEVKLTTAEYASSTDQTIAEKETTTESIVETATLVGHTEPTDEVSTKEVIKDHKETTESFLEVVTSAEVTKLSDKESVDETIKDIKTTSELPLEAPTSTEVTKLLDEVSKGETMDEKDSTTESIIELSTTSESIKPSQDVSDEDTLVEKEVTTELLLETFTASSKLPDDISGTEIIREATTATLLDVSTSAEPLDEESVNETVKGKDSTTESILEESSSTEAFKPSEEEVTKEKESTTESTLETSTSAEAVKPSEEQSIEEVLKDKESTTESSPNISTSGDAFKPLDEISTEQVIKEKESTTESLLEASTSAETIKPSDEVSNEEITKEKESTTESLLEAFTSTKAQPSGVISGEEAVTEKESITEVLLETTTEGAAKPTDKISSEEVVKEKEVTTESLLDTTISVEATKPLQEVSAVSVTSSPDDTIPTTDKASIPETTSIDNQENEVEDFARIPGEGDCLLNSITYKNNSEVPSTNNCHTSCRCISSIIKCDPIICSPPPEYMDNCQPTYDSPDSCCPTYVCHTGETMPPQPDSHMSGTEKPVTSSTVECNDDQCKVKQDDESFAPSDRPEIGDVDEEHKQILPTDKIHGDCGENECPPATDLCTSSDCQAAAPMQPCVGEKCDIETVITPVKDIPLCQNKEDCEPQAVPCEGDSCILPPATDLCANGDCEAAVPEQTCVGDKCNIEPVNTPVKDIPLCENKDDCQPQAAPCEGDSCKHPPSTKDCANGDCQTVVPVQPCVGDKCDIEPDITPVKNIPICQNKEDCEPQAVPCEGDSCIRPPASDLCTNGDCQAAVPVQPCVGDKCGTEPVITPEEIPLCDNKDDCQPQVTPCEGDSCTHVDCSTADCGGSAISPPITKDKKPEVCTDSNDCQKQGEEETKPCLDDSCRRQDNTELENQLPIDCSGSECDKQKPDVVSSGEKIDITTDIPIKDILKEPVTEKNLTQDETSSQYPEQFEESTDVKTPSQTEQSPEQSTPKQDISNELFTPDTTSEIIKSSEFTTRASPITESFDEKLTNTEPYLQSEDVSTVAVLATVTQGTPQKDTTKTEEELDINKDDVTVSTEKTELGEEQSSGKPTDLPVTESEEKVSDETEITTKLPEITEIKTKIPEPPSTEIKETTTASSSDLPTESHEEPIATLSPNIAEIPNVTTEIPQQTSTDTNDKDITDLPKQHETDVTIGTEANQIIQEVTTMMPEVEKDIINVTPQPSYESSNEAVTQTIETDAQKGTITITQSPLGQDTSVLPDKVEITVTETAQKINTDITEPNEIEKTTSKQETPKVTELENVMTTESVKQEISTGELDATTESQMDLSSTEAYIQEQNETEGKPFTNAPVTELPEDKTKISETSTTEKLNDDNVTLQPTLQKEEAEPPQSIVTVSQQTSTTSAEVTSQYEEDKVTKTDTSMTEKAITDTEAFVTEKEDNIGITTDSSLIEQDNLQKEHSTTQASETFGDSSTMHATLLDTEGTTSKPGEESQFTFKPTEISDINEIKGQEEQTTDILPVSDIVTSKEDDILTKSPVAEGTKSEITVTEGYVTELIMETTESQSATVSEDDSQITTGEQEGISTDKQAITNLEDSPVTQKLQTESSLPDSVTASAVPLYTQENVPTAMNEIISQATSTDLATDEKTEKIPSKTDLREGEPTESPIRTHSESEGLTTKAPESDLVTLLPGVSITEVHDTFSTETPVKYPVTDETVIDDDRLSSTVNDIVEITEKPDKFTNKDKIGTPALEIIPTDSDSDVSDITKSQDDIPDIGDKELTTSIPAVVTEQNKESQPTEASELGPKIKDQDTKEPDQATRLPSMISSEEETSTKAHITIPSEISTTPTAPLVTEADVSFATNIPESHIKEDETEVTKIPVTISSDATSSPQEEPTQAPHETISELQTEELLEVTQKPTQSFTEESYAISTASNLDTTQPKHEVMATKKPLETTTGDLTDMTQDKTTERPLEISTEISTSFVTERLHEIPTVSSQLPEDTPSDLQTEIDTNLKVSTTEGLDKQPVTETEKEATTTEKSDQAITEGSQDVITKASFDEALTEIDTKSPIESQTTSVTEVTNAIVTKEPGLLDLTVPQQASTETSQDLDTEKQQTVTTKLPEMVDGEKTTPETLQEVSTVTADKVVSMHDVDTETSTKAVEASTETLQQEITKSTILTEQTSEPKYEVSETTPFVVELEEHTHKTIEEISTILPADEESTTKLSESNEDASTEKQPEIIESNEDTSTEKQPEIIEQQKEDQPTVPPSLPSDDLSKLTTSLPIDDLVLQSTTRTPETSEEKQDEITSQPTQQQDNIEPSSDSVTTISDVEIPVQTEKTPTTEKPFKTDISQDTSVTEEQILPVTSKATTVKIEEEISTSSPVLKPEEKPIETPKPGLNEIQPTDEIPDDESLPSGGPSGYGQEPDYVEEDQAFGPGTCRYGGKVYVSAQQIPRDDPCDFCFCFRSDIICLQQSCPPPIHGCHEEPIQGFCCPRYECPVAMATSLNVTTTTTTTTTTLPPHFLPHAYKGAAQRRGCQIKGHTYKVGEVVRASSGPCLHCTCGGDGQMKCDPKACTPEPMLRQMIAAAVSAKRRR